MTVEELKKEMDVKIAAITKKLEEQKKAAFDMILKIKRLEKKVARKSDKD